MILLDESRRDRDQYIANHRPHNHEENAGGGARLRHWHIIDASIPPLHKAATAGRGNQDAMMKAAYITQTGPPENIIVGDLPTPEPTGSQVLVRVNAAALNPIDTY